MLPLLSSFEADFTQDSRLLRLTTPLGENKLLAESVYGEEAIGESFSFRITALSLDAGISLSSLLGQPALLELLTVNTGQRRPFHGYLTSVELNGADGGLARYTLRLQPWTAFLAHGRDSRIFQDKSVLDILDIVFSGWLGKGRLAPEWRFEVAERGVYPVRSLTTQYQESDLAFAERLMSEEGLFYFFEHDEGSHRLVIADHNGAFKKNAQPVIRFTQPGAVMKEDSIDRWRRELRAQASAVEFSSWDYRTRKTRPVVAASASAAAPELVMRDLPGQYAYAGRKDGQRLAERALQSLGVGRDTYTGAGTVRTLAPGTTFALTEHPAHDGGGGPLLITRVVHLMHNNLSAQIKAAAEQRIGNPPPIDTDVTWASRHAVGSGIGERPLYRNRIDAIPASLPYRGEMRLHVRPAVTGQQTAVVVGPSGAVIHTDRDHRVKLQFHWQRDAGTQGSHNRLSHPNPDGHTGAPGDDSSGTWVRVATPLAPIAGVNWGSHALPRVGQEVLVDFMEGDIDRPVIIGALYNGRGATDAQYNEVAAGAGVATGNAPAWFPGEEDAHAHPAALSGIKSQAMQSSQDGAGAYSQLVFDDTPGQARLALQRHASAHRGTDELNLGVLLHQTDNQRLQQVGFGAELKTSNSAALRAGKGLLLSTDTRQGASGPFLDSREPREQITSSYGMQQALASAAEKHNAVLACDSAAPGEVTAIMQVHSAAEAIGSTAAGAAAYAEAQLQLSSPMGIVAVTPANALLNSTDTTSITAGQDIDIVAASNLMHSVVGGVSLFTYGKCSSRQKPGQETGLKLHAASGKLSTQSSTGPARLTADKTVSISSVASSVSAVAKTRLLMTAQGAGISLEGGNITLQAPGKVEFKASSKELSGPADGSAGVHHSPIPAEIYNEAFVVVDEETKQPLAHVKYRLESESGVVVEGVTDALGRTERIFSKKREKLTLHLPKEE
jgi:type VI secretion system secreted protein VgrG